MRAALIWTDVPDLMEIPAAALDARAGRASPRREAALTLGGARSYVRAFPLGAIRRSATQQRGISHGRWQGFGRDFRSRCAEGDRAGGGRFLGRMVRPVPMIAPGARGDRRLARREGQDRQAQRRREPGDRVEIRHHVDPDADDLQERRDGLAPGRRRAEAEAGAVDHRRGADRARQPEISSNGRPKAGRLRYASAPVASMPS